MGQQASLMWRNGDHKGQLMAFRVTDGSKDDRQPLETLTAARHGKVLGGVA